MSKVLRAFYTSCLQKDIETLIESQHKIYWSSSSRCIQEEWKKKLLVISFSSMLYSTTTTANKWKILRVQS